jgi:hypothetical protein
MLPLLASLAFVGGCQTLEEVKDDIEGLTEPIVVQAVLLGIATPDGIDLSGTEYDNAAVLAVYLADASDPANLENAPVVGAAVSVRSESLGSLPMNDEGGGLYRISAEDADFGYFAGEEFNVVADYDGESRKTVVSAPYAVDTDDIPTTHNRGEEMIVDLTNTPGDYDSVIAAVIDVTTGEKTWSNEPTGVEELYEFTHSDNDVRKVAIPGTAFPVAGVYAVGVAGMHVGDIENYVEVNTALSSFLAGEMAFYGVVVQ